MVHMHNLHVERVHLQATFTSFFPYVNCFQSDTRPLKMDLGYRYLFIHGLGALVQP